jgi:hypothetical protein
MVIFIVAAVATYLLCSRARSETAKLILFRLTVAVLIGTLFVIATGYQYLPIFLRVQRFASAPATIHAMLGALAGFMLYA